MSRAALSTLTKALTLVCALLTVFGVATPVVAASAAPAPGDVTAYPVPAFYPRSTDFALRVETVDVPVVRYTGYDYANLAVAAGTRTVEVTALGQSAITAYQVSPRKLGITGTVSGNRLTFQIQRDEYLIVKVDQKKELVIAADPPETDRPASSGTGIFNVLSEEYRADNTGASLATTALQRAIDDAAAFGTASRRGTVYVPAGLYLMGNLELKSNVALYLEPGAVFRFTGRKADYLTHWHKNSINLDVTWWVRTAFGSTNVKFFGRGVLDGYGHESTSVGKIANNLIVPIATSGFVLDGLTVRDSGSWAITPIRSQDATLTNLKIFNRFDTGEDDGIDVMESQRVNVRNAIGIALDDPFSTKTWAADTDIARSWPGQPQPLDTVTFDDLVSWTVCYGFKVGQGVLQDQSNVTFRNGVVYDAAVGLGVHHRYGRATARNIRFENIDIERISHNLVGDQTWLRLIAEDPQQSGGGTVDGVTVKNITVRDKGKSYAVMRGLKPEQPMRNVTFDNVRMPGLAQPASTLVELNVIDRANHTPVRILPVQRPEPEQRPNLALGKSGSASTAAGPVANAFDGKLNTRWGSARTDNEWLQVDLGAVRAVNGVKIYWEVAYAKAFKMQVSADGTSWRDVYGTSTGDGGIDEIDFSTVAARYVRMTATQRGTKYGYSIWEFEVYESADLAAGRPGSASSGTASGAFDGDDATAWTSNASDAQWLQADLGTSRAVNGIRIDWGAGFGRAYQVRLSDNGTDWRTVHSATTGDGGRDEANFDTVSGRYIRLAASGRETAGGYEVVGLHVYGSANLALRKPGSASTEPRPVANAFDGRPDTRWGSERTEREWLQVDLGYRRVVYGAKIGWEAAYGRSYEILLSDNGTDWRTAFSTTAGDGGTDQINFPRASARYVRMNGLQRGTGYGYSIWEFEVFGPSGPADYATKGGC
ncbi:discoidin domain-containing protein [Lentzea sp. NPDC051213]|uniref:discoidin domain-containing protein n=1 Tax=Lentzea sp. NPDC051213 TaxID=3364126 RepID=UPI0037AB1BF8